ncbi:MAG TPA: hypothetical protein DDW52_26450, partial [Planctomycetaceae bacterium]|nr:hypothetical protein [Planctomycetaceae bacterium]
MDSDVTLVLDALLASTGHGMRIFTRSIERVAILAWLLTAGLGCSVPRFGRQPTPVEMSPQLSQAPVPAVDKNSVPHSSPLSHSQVETEPYNKFTGVGLLTNPARPRTAAGAEEPTAVTLAAAV